MCCRQLRRTINGMAPDLKWWRSLWGKRDSISILFSSSFHIKDHEHRRMLPIYINQSTASHHLYEGINRARFGTRHKGLRQEPDRRLCRATRSAAKRLYLKSTDNVKVPIMSTLSRERRPPWDGDGRSNCNRVRKVNNSDCPGSYQCQAR